MMNKKKLYYCDGICEECNNSKEFTDKKGMYYSCAPLKIKGLKIMPPKPPSYPKK